MTRATKFQQMSRNQLERALADEASHHETAMNRLRKSIGAIGIFLPVLLLIGVIGFAVPMQNSISEFFFTGMREFFVLTLAVMGIFLITYHGYKPMPGEILSDFWVSTIAGATALGVALVPTKCGVADCYSPLSAFDYLFENDNLQEKVHLGIAGIFLTSLGIMSIWLFTRSDKTTRDIHKIRRNRIYVTCGAIVLAMVAVLFVVKMVLGDPWDLDGKMHFTFWVETIAVWAFGISWLVKGEAMANKMPYLHGGKP